MAPKAAPKRPSAGSLKRGRTPVTRRAVVGCNNDSGTDDASRDSASEDAESDKEPKRQQRRCGS
jgi:hypothetical protein